MMRSASTVAALIAASSFVGVARADEPAPPPPPPNLLAPPPATDGAPTTPRAPPSGPTLVAPEKRAPQDYDGRPDQTTTAEDALWIPRVAFYPFYFVTEIVVRKPLGALVTAIERADVISKVTDFFAFGPNHSVGVVPTAFYDFGFNPSVGIYYFYDDFLAKNNNVRATISTGGEKFLKARVVDRIPLKVEKGDDGIDIVRTWAQVEIDGLARPDYLFYGVGWDSAKARASKFEQRSVGGGARVHVEPVKGSFVESWLLARHHLFADESREYDEDEGDDPDDLPLRRAVERGFYPTPFGFDEFTTLKVGARGVIDTRKPRPYPGSGFGADGRVELVTDVVNRGSWMRADAQVSGFLDLTGARRVLGLTLDARMIQPFGDTRVPFTELIGAMRTDSAPEDDLIRGFLPGRLLGESSVVATLEYSWPIWSFIDATMQAQVGNVFARNFEDFDFERLRFSFVGGFRSPNHRDHALNLLLGFGTQPFALGGAPDSVRFLVGGTTGF